MPSVIVLAVDGLRASALGAYGNTWRAIPAFDRLAAESVLAEWAYASQIEPANFYHRDILSNASWQATKLVTDDESIVNTLGCQSFDEALLVSPPSAEAPASDLAATQLAAGFGAFADVLADTDFSSQSEPQLLWFHSKGLSGAWDAPLGMIHEFVEEDDPTPEPCTIPASGAIDRREDPDSVFAAAARYAAQMAVLDACLEGWLDLLDEVTKENPPSLIVVGTRGYALGEHGLAGIDGAVPCSESRHVPLLLRPAAAFQENALGCRFSEGFIAANETASIASQLAHSSNASELLAQSASSELVMHGTLSNALRTKDWLLLQAKDSQARQLYAKPDDRWEANDVATIEPDLANELAEQLTQLIGRSS